MPLDLTIKFTKLFYIIHDFSCFVKGGITKKEKMEKLKNFPGTTIAIVPDNRTSWLDAKYKDFKMKEYVSSLVLGGDPAL